MAFSKMMKIYQNWIIDLSIRNFALEVSGYALSKYSDPIKIGEYPMG